MMVQIAEALREPFDAAHAHVIRWESLYRRRGEADLVCRITHVPKAHFA